MILNQLKTETVEDFITASVECKKSLTQSDRKTLLDLVEDRLFKGSGNSNSSTKAVKRLSLVLKQNAQGVSSSKLSRWVRLIRSLWKGCLNFLGLRVSTALLTTRAYAVGLHADVQLSKNIRDIREAQVVLIGETHCVPLHSKLENFILSHFQTSVKEDCLLLESHNPASIAIQDIKTGVKKVITPGFQARLFGWDNEILLFKHAKILTKLREINAKKEKFFDKIPEYKKLNEEIKESLKGVRVITEERELEIDAQMENILDEYQKYKRLKSEYKQLSNEEIAVMQQRNASLVSSVSQHLHHPGKIFVIAGIEHVSSEKYSALKAIQEKWPDAKIASICFKDAVVDPQAIKEYEESIQKMSTFNLTETA